MIKTNCEYLLLEKCIYNELTIELKGILGY